MPLLRRTILIVFGILCMLLGFRIPYYLQTQADGQKINPVTAPVLPVRNEGDFSLITYNTAGLPFHVYALARPETNHTDAGQRLAALNPDIILLQEDFSYHSYIATTMAHFPYHSEPAYRQPHNTGLSLNGLTQVMWQFIGALNQFMMKTNDGLNRVSRLYFNPAELHREKWEVCSNLSATDCLAPKGFSFAVHHLAEGQELHVYNLHKDAGTSSRDKKARRAQVKQLLRKIQKRSANKAIIVAGDFNLQGKIKEDRELINEFSDYGLKDACDSSNEDCDVLDRILYKSDESLEMIVKTYRRLEEFLDSYSDHAPVWAEFSWNKL